MKCKCGAKGADEVQKEQIKCKWIANEIQMWWKWDANEVQMRWKWGANEVQMRCKSGTLFDFSLIGKSCSSFQASLAISSFLLSCFLLSLFITPLFSICYQSASADSDQSWLGSSMPEPPLFGKSSEPRYLLFPLHLRILVEWSRLMRWFDKPLFGSGDSFI